MKYAIVKDGVVVNVIEYAEQPSSPPAGFEDGHVAVQADAVSIGWTYANGTFTDPNPSTQTTFEIKSLTDMILESPTELAKLKQALGIV
tara:strand:- start:161 stop:427 length:267 start_codon:yes stop_codon:yes gene_type:complete